ncbi:MAG: cold shock domain-containing protein [Bacteroidales bacterium]|nr:cold shock domain-containing protein [Bacteroidales bacterium]
MAKSQQSFLKKEKEKARLKKRKDKLEKKQARKTQQEGKGQDDMIAYVDEFGNPTDTPPDPTKKKKIDASNIEISVPKKEKIQTDIIRHGKVEFFNNSKGYGFIKDSETQESYFVHINGCIDDIADGDKVNFELERGAKGMNAVKVKTD